MKRLGALMLATLTTFTAAGVHDASAGATQTYGVWFSPNAFEGVFSSARNSADAYQQISCEINTWSSGYSYGYCYAHDNQSSSAFRNCYVTEMNMLAAVESAAQDDMLRVTYDPATGHCTYIGVVKSSRFDTK